MKMQADDAPGVNVISHVESGGIRVNREPYTGSVLVPWTGSVLPWAPGDFDALREEHFAVLLDLQPMPELVIFGSGAQLRFCHPSLLKPLIERRIGIETMDTAAACRTYNVLAGEGRHVAAVLLPMPR
jgi:uncharacterized protein